MAVSLKIKGNKRTNEGIGNDLVSIGDNRFPVIDAQYPGTKGATDFIVIRHLHDKSVYTIVCKNVTPCDSNREGTLYISVSVPVKEHVAGLFNMLIELQNAYKSTCMTYDGTMYHFMARNDIAQPFEKIIAAHKVSHYPYKTVATSDDTTSMAYLFMTPEQISDLLNDPMRGEFSRYGQVVLVPVSDPSQYVSTLNIPAKIWRSYKIYVNGRQTGQTLSDPNKTVTITLPETAIHESVSATFSIAQARDTRMPGIAVDDEAQIIYLNMQPKLKPVVKPTVETSELTEKRAASGSKKPYILIAAGTIAVLAVLAYVLFFSPKEEKPQKHKEKAPIETPKNQDGDNNPEAALDGDNPDEAKTDADSTGGGEETPETTDGKNPKETTPSDKLLNQDKDSGNKANPDVKAKLLEDYNSDKAAINKAEDLSFGLFRKIHRRHTNYDQQAGYLEFKNKVDFINDVVGYIRGLSEKTSSKDYKAKIQSLAQKAGELGLNGLKAKLEQRIAGGAEDIKKSKKINNQF